MDNKQSLLNFASVLLYMAGALIIMGIITGEVYYPSGYTTRLSQISDLGATVPPNSVITQPSATIFNFTMIITGSMILLATFFLQKVFKKWLFSIMLGLLGFGILGVGIFPGNVTPWHGLFSMLTFNIGAIAAIVSFKIVKTPLRYVFMVSGLVTLIFFWGASYFIPLLGAGGTERWVAYPVVFYLMGMGGYVAGRKDKLLAS